MRIIAGRWRGHTIAAPPGARTRPTTDRVREAWLGALHLELPGSTVLDLFAGSGALGLEALSRGAATATFVERAQGPLRALRANIEKLDARASTRVVQADALRFVRTLPPHAFDLALADPPYDTGAAAALVEIFLAAPFARALWIEHRAREPLPAPPDARTRRYGDTALTMLRAATAEGEAAEPVLEPPSDDTAE